MSSPRRGETTGGRDDRGATGRGGVGLILGIAVAAVAASTWTGCPEPFEPYWKVDKFRVLGIKADPATLQPGEQAEISVLDYAPPGTQVSYEWSWCPVDPPAQSRYECPVREALAERDAGSSSSADAGMGMFGGASNLDPSFFDLGTGPTASLPYPGTSDQVLKLCRQIQQSVAQGSGLGGTLSTTDCRRGYEIAVRLRATSSRGETEIAKKKFTLSTGGDESNANPEHGGIEIRVADAEDIPKLRERLDWVPPASEERSDQWYALPEEGATPVVAEMSYDVRAVVGEESVERWRPPAPRGAEGEEPSPRRERLSFRWFVEEGTVEQAQRIFIPGSNKLDELRKTTFTVEEVPEPSCKEEESAGAGRDPACRVQLWSVVRDGRNGIDWSERRVRVVGSVDSNSN